MFAQRLFLLYSDAKYLDVLERLLYNAIPAGIGLSGNRFFYLNPLESDGVTPFNKGSVTRRDWFNCPCCPTNLVRFIPSIPSFIYAADDDGLYVNLFMAGAGEIAWQGHRIRIEQKTSYPWDGRVQLNIKPDQPITCGIKIRIPGWVRHEPVPGDLYADLGKETVAYSIRVNGHSINPSVEKGFALLHRKWQRGDSIQVMFAMPVRVMTANPNVNEDRKKIAIERGPLVYCAEQVDNGSLEELALSKQAHYRCEHRPDLLGGVTLIKSTCAGAARPGRELTLVPYAVWSNRAVGAMKVWLPYYDGAGEYTSFEE